jgi:hypothetical protein
MKNQDLVIGAAVVGAFLLLHKKALPAASAAIYTPSAVGATLQQQAADAARNAGLLSLFGSVFKDPLQNSVVTPESRAITRAGDPYYHSDAAGIGGTVPGVDATAATAIAYGQGMPTYDAGAANDNYLANY